MVIVNETVNPRKMLLIGAGGIGSQVLELLTAGLRRVGLTGSITVMDGDVVETSNLGHQRYTKADVGRPKVTCLAERLDDANSTLRVVGDVNNLRNQGQLEGYDLVMVCVDRPEPRRLVHGLTTPWLDVRCSGDGWVVGQHGLGERWLPPVRNSGTGRAAVLRLLRYLPWFGA